jgi:hypothetical protein
MADYIMTIKCGDKSYHLSASGKDVYYSSDNKTGGLSLKGAKMYNNEIRSTSDNKPLSEAQLCILIKKSNASGCCFISTAVCLALGKSDDCRELTVLRRFRDEVMASDPRWEPLIGEYYALAPDIAARLLAAADCQAWSQRLYDAYLQDCIRLIEAGEHARAIARYRDMVDDCQQMPER